MDDHKEPSDAQASQKAGPEELGSAATGAEPVTRAQDGGAPGTAAAGPAAGDIQWLPLPPPPPPLRTDPNELWRAFFNLTGGSLLYCLSALFITFGIAKMLVPLLVEPETVRAALPCLSALNVYELALLGTLLFIVLRENVTDDAISLVVLVALFMVGSGIALTCVSGTEPRPALVIGALALALAAGKLVSLRACVGLALRGPLFVGLLALVAWNFLVGPLLAQRHASVIVTKAVWQVSWLVLLASGALALSGSVWRPFKAAATPAARGCEEDGLPFLRREPMAVIVALILWCAAVVHQRVLGMVFVFDVHMVAGDYLPAFSVAVLLGLRLSLSLRRQMGVLETILALVPLLVCLAMLDPSCMTVARRTWIGLLWHPPVLLALTAAAIGAMCWHVRRKRLYIVAAAYALGIFLTWGFNPNLQGTLNEKPVAALLIGLPFIYSLVRRQLAVSIACASIGVYASFGAGVFDCLHAVHASTPFTTALGVWGAAMLIIAWRCKEKAPPAVRVLGALALMIGAFGGLPSGPSATWLDAGFAAAAAAACAAVWLCFRDHLPAVLLGLPVLVRTWMLTERCAGWRYVALSFLLLFAGAAVSVRKAHRRARAASVAARADC